MKRVFVRVPATSANLGPGFDTLGVALGLYNDIRMQASGPWSRRRAKLALEVVVTGEGAETLPRDARNLVIKSAFRVFANARRWPRTLQVSLYNRIPLSRGLGSSAAAVAGGLSAANALVGSPLSSQALLNLAAGMEGHPDNVAPALFGGFCVSAMTHGGVQFLRWPMPSGLTAVVCSPETMLKTRKARDVLPARVPFSAAVHTSSRVAMLMGAILQRRWDLLALAMDDVLHQPARAKLVPGLAGVIAAAHSAGAYGAALSGAGSSVIALCPPRSAARVGRAMNAVFVRRGVDCRVRELPFDNKGVRIS